VALRVVGRDLATVTPFPSRRPPANHLHATSAVSWGFSSAGCFTAPRRPRRPDFVDERGACFTARGRHGLRVRQLGYVKVVRGGFSSLPTGSRSPSGAGPENDHVGRGSLVDDPTCKNFVLGCNLGGHARGLQTAPRPGWRRSPHVCPTIPGDVSRCLFRGIGVPL
jgi:hypothetical protein